MGLSTMGFALPGAIAAKLAAPDRRVLAAVGDGAFLMNSQELETAVRERIPLTVLIWQDDAYGLIKWKMNLETWARRGHRLHKPGFRGVRREFRSSRDQVRVADDLLPMLNEALAEDAVSVIACPVDYAENLRLTATLGDLAGPF